MSYLTPDLTGLDPDHKVINHMFMHIKHEQVFNFYDVIFADSLTIDIVGTTNIRLTAGLDYIVTEDNIDYDAMSTMKLKDKGFNKTLIRSITIMKPYIGIDTKMLCSYQQLYPVPNKVARRTNVDKINFTPDLLYQMLIDIERHSLLLSPIEGSHTLTDANPLLLEFDKDMVYPENVIKDEIHEADTLNGRTIIRPACGSFFRSSIAVSRIEADTLVPLIEDIDYRITGLDVPKTSLITETSGAYKYVVLITPINGEINITYHAVGGEPTVEDLRAIDTNVNNIMNYVVQHQLLTEDTLDTVPIIQNYDKRLVALESEVRKLAAEGTPSYGDVSSGNSVLKKIVAPDTNTHWWSVATLYTVSGSNTVFTSDMMKLNVKTLNTEFQFSVTANVNINNTVNPFELTVQSSLNPSSYIPFEDYSQLENVIRPQFRIIYNDNIVEQSGIVLQIGFQLRSVYEESIVIEDVSGAQSCWKLIPEVDTAIGPQDDIIMLPSGHSVWATDNPDSREYTYLVPLTSGHIAWVGSEALNRPAGLRNISLEHFLEKDIDIRRIKKIKYDLEEAGGARFSIITDMLYGIDESLGSTTFSYNGNAVYFNSNVARDTSGNIVMGITVDVRAGLGSNQLNLRHVTIYT